MSDVNFSYMNTVQERMDLQNLLHFHAHFKTSQVDEQTAIFSSSNSSFLLKCIDSQLSRDTTCLQETKNTFDLHQDFDQRLFLTLLHYEIIEKLPQNTTIRAVYRHGKHSLQDQINKRIQEEQSFSVEQLWRILIAVVQGFSYLEARNISFGVLDCTRIFLEERIRLVDPSSVGINPYEPEAMRLCSPEIFEEREDIDIFRSDVYVLGMCILETALLSPCNPNPASVSSYLDKIDQYNDEGFSWVLRAMLQEDPQDRISVEELKDFLTERFEDCFQLNEIECNCPDREDLPSEMVTLEAEQCQNCDLQTDREYDPTSQLTELEEAQKRFIFSRRGNGHSWNASQQSLSQQDMPLKHSQSQMFQMSQMSHMKQSSQAKQVTKRIKNKLVTNVPSEVFQEYDMSQSNEHLYTNPKLMSMIQSSMMSLSKKISPMGFSGTNKENFMGISVNRV